MKSNRNNFGLIIITIWFIGFIIVGIKYPKPEVITCLLILLIMYIVLLFVTSRRQKQPGVTDKPEQELIIQEIPKNPPVKRDKEPSSKKGPENTEKKNPPKIQKQTNSNSTNKQTQSQQAEPDIITKALTLYKTLELENKESVNIEDVIHSTTAQEILWSEGSDDKKSIEAWAADYQKGLLGLYKDLNQKKYLLVYFDDNKGFIQPYTKIVELRQEIIRQIENRKKKVVLVQMTRFLVRTNTFKCTKNHGIEDIIAVFKVLNKSGNIITVETPAGHCEKCGIFYIHEHIYQKLLTYGQPLCTVISEKQYISGSYTKMNSGMAQQSLLRMCGYTVSASEGLSDNERRTILENIIRSGIMSKFDIITYIYYFINIRKHDTKDMSEAIKKWKSDIRYLENLNVNTIKRYNVDRIYRIEK